MIAGIPFIKQVVSFTDADGASSITAQINWGDGVTTPGAVLATGGNNFIVVGVGLYTADGTYPVHVTINDSDGAQAQVSAEATAADALLTSHGVIITEKPAVAFTNTVVATFADANIFEPTSDFTAMISWGDKTTSVGTIVEDAPGVFSVEGSHDYTTAGNYGITVTIVDKAGTSTIADSTAVVSNGVPLKIITGPTLPPDVPIGFPNFGPGIAAPDQTFNLSITSNPLQYFIDRNLLIHNDSVATLQDTLFQNATPLPTIQQVASIFNSPIPNINANEAGTHFFNNEEIPLAPNNAPAQNQGAIDLFLKIVHELYATLSHIEAP